MSTTQTSNPSKPSKKAAPAYEVAEVACGHPRKRGAPRISRKMLKAIRLRVRKGNTITDACALAGIAEQTWHKNMKRPHVVACFDSEKEKYIQEVESLEKRHKARALEVAAELMEDEKNPNVRARMVEFLRGGKSGGVTVNLNNTVNSGGYDYPSRDEYFEGKTEFGATIDGKAEDVTPKDEAN